MNEDLELVRRYADAHSEEAFAALVSRYVHLVYSVALRQVGDPHLADEITQAVFIILARKAATLGPKTIVSAWLCRTSRYAAADALKTQHRRQRREQEAYMQSLSNESQPDAWAQIAPLLEASLAQLGSRDHDAVVLRFLEGKSFAEVGAALGTTENAAKMRVGRALDRLRAFFARRGVCASAALIAAAVSANSVQAAPPAVAASAAAALNNPALPASTLALVRGTLELMTWVKLKFALGAVAILLLAGGTVTVGLSSSGSGKPVPAEILKRTQQSYAALGSCRSSGTVVLEAGGHFLTNAFSLRLGRPDFCQLSWTRQGTNPPVRAGVPITQRANLGFAGQGTLWSAGDGYFLLLNETNYYQLGDANRAFSATFAGSGGIPLAGVLTFFGMEFNTFAQRFQSKYPLASNLVMDTPLNAMVFSRLKDQKVGDTSCYVLGSRAYGAETTLWIGKDDSLIHRARYALAKPAVPSLSDADVKEALARRGLPVTPESVASATNWLARRMEQALKGPFSFTETYAEISTNSVLEKEAFTQDVPASWTPLTSFP
jgi:RNA polymerase sigma factor (sigma-70 family)